MLITLLNFRKYGFEIISISSDDESSNTNISKAKSAFSSKTNAYLFIIKGTEENDTIKAMTDAGAKLAEINPMYTLTDDEIKMVQITSTLSNHLLIRLKKKFINFD